MQEESEADYKARKSEKKRKYVGKVKEKRDKEKAQISRHRERESTPKFKPFEREKERAKRLIKPRISFDNLNEELEVPSRYRRREPNYKKPKAKRPPAHPQRKHSANFETYRKTPSREKVRRKLKLSPGFKKHAHPKLEKISIKRPGSAKDMELPSRKVRRKEKAPGPAEDMTIKVRKAQKLKKKREPKPEEVPKGTVEEKAAIGGERRKPPAYDFGEIKPYEPLKLFTGETGLPSSDPLLLIIVGEDGIGRKVVRDLLVDELHDRGREARISDLGELNNSELHEEITSDETLSNYGILPMQGNISSLEGKSSLRVEMENALRRRGDLRYILLESSEEAEKGKAEEILSDFPWWEQINLAYNRESIHEDSNILIKLGEFFAAVNNSKVDVEKIASEVLPVEEVAEKRYIDSLWTKIRKKRRSAVESLRPKYRKETGLAPLENESDEHYIMRMLTYATLRNEVEKEPDVWTEKEWEEECKDEGAEIRIEYPKGGPKRVDFYVKIGDEKIWAEVETCKSLEDPIENAYQKLEKIADIKQYFPTQIWIVLPCRKLWAYGREKIEKSLRNRLEELLSDKEVRVRIFLANLFDECLEELT